MKRSYSYDLSLLNISLLSVFLILLSGFQAQARDKFSLLNQSNEQLALNVKATDSRQVVSTSARDLLEQEARGQELAQNPQQALTRVTGVEVKPTPSGVQVILKTPSGQPKLVPLILPDGNNLVVEILDATLAFSIRNGVTQTNPAPGIKEVRVSKIDATSIRVTIAGEKQAPSAEVVPGRQDLVLSVTPKAIAQTQADEEIEIVVTGEREEGVSPGAPFTVRGQLSAEF
jgi:hypothetical protein